MVGLVALPLALGFGVSSGMGAAAGLVTAIIAGALAAIFGGSRVQVSGPTGAMTVVLVPIIAAHGADGVLVVGLLAGVRQLLATSPQQAAALAGALGTGGGGDPGSPQRFTFEPLRRHYLFLTYSRPRVADDWTLGASAVLNVADLSGQLIPQVTWSAQEWLSLTAAAFVPLPGVDALAAEVAGEPYPEGAMSPTDWRAQLSFRLFF